MARAKKRDHCVIPNVRWFRSEARLAARQSLRCGAFFLADETENNPSKTVCHRAKGKEPGSSTALVKSRWPG